MDPDPLPESVVQERVRGESVSEYRAAPQDLRGSSSARVMGFADFAIEFNSLTGDLTIASRTETIVVNPVSPGKIRLSSKRRDGEDGVRV